MDDVMVISDGEGIMDEDLDDYWDDDGSSSIDLMGEDEDDSSDARIFGNLVMVNVWMG